MLPSTRPANYRATHPPRIDPSSFANPFMAYRRLSSSSSSPSSSSSSALLRPRGRSSFLLRDSVSPPGRYRLTATHSRPRSTFAKATGSLCSSPNGRMRDSSYADALLGLEQDAITFRRATNNREKFDRNLNTRKVFQIKTISN